MPMNASTSGSNLGSSSRKRWGRQPETIKPWPRLFASRTSADSRMVSTLSSCAESMNEHVLTMTTSACEASLVISTPLFRSEPSMISASTRFLAQPREIRPTRTGLSADFSFIKDDHITPSKGWRQLRWMGVSLDGRILTLPPNAATSERRSPDRPVDKGFPVNLPVRTGAPRQCQDAPSLDGCSEELAAGKLP